MKKCMVLLSKVLKRILGIHLWVRFSLHKQLVPISIKKCFFHLENYLIDRHRILKYRIRMILILYSHLKITIWILVKSTKEQRSSLVTFRASVVIIRETPKSILTSINKCYQKIFQKKRFHWIVH